MKKAKVSFFPVALCLGGLLSIAGGAARPQEIRSNPWQKLMADAAKERGPRPDLAVAMKPGPFKKPNVAGDNILSLVQATVLNGGKAAAQNFGVAVLLSTGPSIVFDPSPHASLTTGRIIGQTIVKGPLLPGASAAVGFKATWDTTGLPWGEYFVTVLVDPGKTVAEGNETNNSAQAGFFRQAFVQYIDMSCIKGPILDFHGRGFGHWTKFVTAHVGGHTFEVPQSDEWKDDHVHVHVPPGLLPLASQEHECYLYFQSQVMTAGDHTIPWGLFLWHATPGQGSPGTALKLDGCNFQSAQGTKKLQLWQGENYIVDVAVTSWSEEIIMAVIPNAPPGNYILHIYDQGVRLTIYGGEPLKIE